MRIVIDIPDEDYKRLKEYEKAPFNSLTSRAYEAIAKGTPLPKNHGDLIDREALKNNINGWYAFMKDICKQPYMTMKQEEIIGKIDMMTTIIEADTENEE